MTTTSKQWKSWQDFKMEAEKVEGLVKKICEKYPDCRHSNQKIITRYLAMLFGWTEERMRLIEEGINFEALARARRKLYPKDDYQKKLI